MGDTLTYAEYGKRLDEQPEPLTKAQEKWLAALEADGTYLQIDGELHIPDRPTEDSQIEHRYCCLGVACREAESCDIPVKVESDYRFDTHVEIIAGGNLESQPAVISWLNLRSADGDAWEDDDIGVTSCVNMNDREHLTFKQIAQAIREKPGRYFRQSWEADVEAVEDTCECSCCSPEAASYGGSE